MLQSKGTWCVGVLMAAIGAGSAAAIQDAPSAKEVLTRSAEALKNSKLVKYEATFEATGWAKRFAPEITGMAVVGQRSKWDLDEFYCEVKMKKGESEEVLEYKAGCDGDTYYLLDAKTKKVHVDMDVAVMGSQNQDIMRVVLGEFAQAEPFKDFLAVEGAEVVGSETVDGHECFQVKDPSGRGQPVWSISKKDYLPRRIKRSYPPREDSNGEGATTQLTLTHLTVDPKLERNYFRPQVPEGFTKTDEFAP